MGKGNKNGGNALFKLAVLPVVIAFLFSFYKTFQANDPITFILPNLLLFTPFRETTRSLWNALVRIDKTKPIEPKHIPVIQAKDYTWEKLRIATENWRYPAIVRDFFKGTPAMTKWPTKEYFPSRIGQFSIPVVHEAIVGKVQNNRSIMSFKDAHAEIMNDPQSKTYLFFPVQSRFHFNHSDLGSIKALQLEVNSIVRDDLDLDRIWKGFGTPAHSSYFGSQLIIGRGMNDSDATTGTGWHCAAGNNWFAQVVGRKRWYFMDPKYSAYMYPLRGGRVNMMTGNKDMGELQKYLPLRYADVNAGDLLYNPDWEWHTIKNYEGLSIGVPIREVNFTLSLQNNFQYSSIVLINKFLEKFNLDIGGYPPTK